jgi:tetratricopeptide (TPR) repeat protein
LSAPSNLFRPILSAVALSLLGFVGMAKTAVAAPGDEPAEEPPVRVAIAPADKIGSLPPFTLEIGKRAARAFLEGNWLEARDAYLTILKADPENPLTLANLGATELQLKNYDKARDHLKKALRNNPEIHQARVTLGLVYLESDQTYLAISTLSRAVADHPKDARAHNYLAVAARELGWLSAAERELQAAVAAEPDFAEAHYNLSLAYMERRPPSVELARRHYQRALDLGAVPDPKLAARISDESK